ncbi:MAG: ISC system 2Fe-2S type ferredoxin [Gammaproteobacteria bacterium]
MPKIKVYPHEELCPDGIEIESEEGQSLCEALLENKIKIEHACELSCACTTCHVLVRKGFNNLNESTDDEEDMLDKAWGLEAESRLSCQIVLGEEDLEIEIPKYTINMVSEDH